MQNYLCRHAHTESHIRSPNVVFISPHRNLSTPPKLFFSPCFFFLLVLFLAAFRQIQLRHGASQCCEQVQHRTVTSMSCGTDMLGALLEAESWAQETLGQFLPCCDSPCADHDKRMEQRTEVWGRRELLQPVDSCLSLAAGSNPPQDSRAWKALPAAVLLARCLWGVHHCTEHLSASWLVDTGLFCRKDAFTEQV